MPAGLVLGGASFGSGSRATATSHPVTFTVNPPIGSLLCMHYTLVAGVTLTSIADDGSNTWTSVTVASTSAVILVGLSWCFVTAAITTVTITPSATCPMCWTASAFGGGAGGGYLQAGGTAAGTGSLGTAAAQTGVSSSASVPAPVANRLVVQSVGNNLAATGITPAAGFIEVDDTGTATAGGRIDSSYAFVNSGSGGVVTGATGGSASWAFAGASFNMNEPQPRRGRIDVFRAMPSILKAMR